MASEQQFCLRWNNHQSTLVSVFDTLLESGTLVDCTLAAEGQYLKAHKVVLSACSPYFELLLSQHYEKHPIIILKDVKFQELKAMMDYMYRGEVNISQDQLGALLKAAESLQIKGLSDSGGGGTEKEEPAEKYVEDKKPVTAPVRTSQSAAHNSGLTIERRRSAPVDSTEDDSQPLPKGMSSREGSSSPVPRKRKKQRRRSSGGEAGGESNALQDSHDQTSSSSERSQPVPNMSQSLPASIATVPSSVKSSGETDQKLVNAEVFPTRTSHSQPSIPREPDVVQKVEPPAEVLLEPKAEYLDEDVNEDSVEDLTLDDDDDLDMSMDHAQPGPSHGGEGSSQGYAPWHIGDQSRDEVFMAAQEAVGAHRDSQGARPPLLGVLPFPGLPLPDQLQRLYGAGGWQGAGCPPFVCPSCQRAYLHKTNLQKHVRFECGKEPQFRCKLCPQRFTQNHNLKKHVQKRHASVHACPPGLLPRLQHPDK
ncbi:longitudinals lacking protein, isoforms A/B/D/L-like isoform X4 [Bacillus rossius redtenbacheri]|uniref:longitudinals lacking protein, isoforms A/B/D/L-like isoform X4 n=1 Tax=Bacillus rossius redtenbacheri TaxID=93214 RepID=UPI002FDC952A